MKKENKFKVGDRVAVYAHTLGRAVGEVSDVQGLPPYWLNVQTSTCGVVAHPKQCRKLVKKERRRVWVKFNHVHGMSSLYEARPEHEGDFVEFIEVKKK